MNINKAHPLINKSLIVKLPLLLNLSLIELQRTQHHMVVDIEGSLKNWIDYKHLYYTVYLCLKVINDSIPTRNDIISTLITTSVTPFRNN